MNQKENSELKSIAKHVEVLNSELGKVQNDVMWMKRIIYYIAVIISVGVGQLFF